MTSINATWEPGWPGFGGRAHARAARRRFAAFARRGPRPNGEPGGEEFHAEFFDPRPGPHGRGRPHHGRHGRFGPPEPGAGFPGPEFGPRRPGPDFGFGPGPRGRRGRRSRGDIRLAVLALLAEQPRHGYEIIQEIAERTRGAWRASPGSVYPTLQQLADEGLVRIQDSEGRRTVELTEAGTSYVEEHRDELAKVWLTEGDEISEATANLHAQYGQLHAAVAQVMTAGTDEQREAAAAALAEARKTIYRTLAE